MKNFFLPTIAFVLGFIGVAGYQYLRPRQVTAPSVVSSTALQPTQEPTFALIPPSEAVSGTFTVVRGYAKKLSRTDSEYTEASTGAQILLGESVATMENSSATATVAGIVHVRMGPSAELVFANLFPNNFVLQQKAGKIDYQVTGPISVRVLHTLVVIRPGETTINIIDTDTSVTVKAGSVKFALVDRDNNTRVWDLKAGERANIDDVARQAFLIKSR